MKKCNVILLSAVILSGCAGTKFYKQEVIHKTTDGLEETGIPFYPPKPYLLVARTGEKDKPVSASIIYLPDMSKPIYAVPKSGLGSANLTMGFSNGLMTTFGQQTDTKITELITSLAGVPGLLATAAKTRAEANKPHEQSSTRPELAAKIQDIANSLSDLKNVTGFTSAFDSSDIKKISNVIRDLNENVNNISNPTNDLAPQMASLTETSKSLGAIKPSDTSPANDAANVWNQLKTIQVKLQKLISDEQPKAEPEPVAELYEIIIANGKTTLKAANMESAK